MIRIQPMRGVSLTEVLVAVVILSIGLLGIAGLQIKGLRGAHSSHLRSQATFLANDMAERIRANPMGANNPVAAALPTNSTYADVSLAAINCDANVTQCINNSAAPCTTAQMATYDIQTWLCGHSPQDGLRNILPQANGTISCVDLAGTNDGDNCSPGSTLTLRVSWGGKNAAGEQPQTHTVELLVVP